MKLALSEESRDGREQALASANGADDGGRAPDAADPEHLEDHRPDLESVATVLLGRRGRGAEERQDAVVTGAAVVRLRRSSRC